MTRLVRSLAPLCAALSLAVASGCRPAAKATANPKIDIDITVNSPTAPTNPEPSVTSVTLDPSGSITRPRSLQNGVCVAVVRFKVTIVGTGAFYNKANLEVNPMTGAVSVTRVSDLEFDVRFAEKGTFKVVGISAGNGYKRSAETTVIVTGDCDGSTTPPAPGPGPGPTADIKADGKDGPITVGKDSFVVFSWSFTNAPYCNLSSSNGSLSGMVGGPGAQTVKVSANMSATLTCPGTNGGTATDTAQVNVTSSPTPTLSCSGMNAAYSRTDGSSSLTVAVNQNVPIRLNQQSGWLSHCETFWGVNHALVIQANGTIPIEVCSGGGCFWYGGGKFASVKGVWPGKSQVFAQVVIRENMGTANERWVLATGPNMRYSPEWTVVSGLTSLLGLKMPEGPKWIYDSRVPGGKLCLTFECR